MFGHGQPEPRLNYIFLFLVNTARAKGEPSCSLECSYLTFDDYKDLLWTTLAEFPGMPNYTHIYNQTKPDLKYPLN